MNPWNEPEDGAEVPAPKDSQAPSQQTDQQWKLIEKVVMTHSRELRSSRRWGILFKSLTFTYLFAILYFGWSSVADVDFSNTGGHTAVVQVRGVIADGEEASADHIISGLRDAFRDPDTKGVVIRINSGGGSPVQSGYVYDEIDRLQLLYPDIPVAAVIIDTGASGAYYIAAAADTIYADKASIVGSIGVTAVSFGYVDAMQKVGVERRQFTSGDHKAFLDPFVPVREDEQVFFEAMLDQVHQQFIAAVKQGRGDRLRSDPQLFTGLFWTGEQAVTLGLIDGLKSTSQVAREWGYPEVVDFSPSLSAWQQFTKDLGISMGSQLSKIFAQGTPSMR